MNENSSYKSGKEILIENNDLIKSNQDEPLLPGHHSSRENVIFFNVYDPKNKTNKTNNDKWAFEKIKKKSNKD